MVAFFIAFTVVDEIKIVQNGYLKSPSPVFLFTSFLTFSQPHRAREKK